MSAAEVFSSLLLGAVRGAEHAAELFRISPWMNSTALFLEGPAFISAFQGELQHKVPLKYFIIKAFNKLLVSYSVTSKISLSQD